jgi:hypothetical protein
MTPNGGGEVDKRWLCQEEHLGNFQGQVWSIDLRQ